MAGQAAATTQQLYNVAKIELLKYNPEWDFPEITCPVLALNGDKDCQVPVENLEFIRKGISENGNTQVKTIVFPGLNHMFQPAVTGSPVEYSDIEETIAPVVLQEISLNGVKSFRCFEKSWKALEWLFCEYFAIFVVSSKGVL